MSEPARTRVKIDLKLRRCVRCKHWECTHCRTFCDDGDCIGNGTPCPEGQCEYASPMDVEGYKRFDEMMDELMDKTSTEFCHTWFDRHVADTTEEDGTVFIEFDETPVEQRR